MEEEASRAHICERGTTQYEIVSLCACALAHTERKRARARERARESERYLKGMSAAGERERERAYASAASGSSAQAATDTLLIDTDTVVVFGSISGEAISTFDVGTTQEGTVWCRAAAALQFARGFVNPEHAKKLLSKMLLEDGVPDGFQRGW